MVGRPLSYTDAVRLLGGEDSRAFRLIDGLSSAAVGVTAAATVGNVDFFALRSELIRWGTGVIANLREKVTGVSRLDRTERLVAAHSIIVVTSFYQAIDRLAESHRELRLDEARITAGEQAALATGAPVDSSFAGALRSFLNTPPPLPSPHQPFEVTVERLWEFYGRALISLNAFLSGLQPFERKPDQIRLLLRSATEDVIRASIARYTEAYRALATQAPEFGVWAAMTEAGATRDLIRESVSRLAADLEALQRTGPGTALDAAVRGLRTRHGAALDRTVLTSSEAPEHVVLPTLGAAYVNPHGRVRTAGPSDQPSTEAWWDPAYPVVDVQGFLLAHLTGPVAVERPLVILGHPGSGKSALTRILAARLPAESFLIVRVELRSVRADATLQGQIEEALLQALGEDVSWPDLVRRAGGALPVVILDGFDELIQATGVNRADYLEQVRRFQRREAELGRPVAAIVTSRTVVADRARFPPDTIVLRLEPFDEDQVRAWLTVWNNTNEAGLRDRGLHALTAGTVLNHGELATQPLLLLLLGLYDAGSNALRRGDRHIGRAELYERLFADFVDREVSRREPHLAGDQHRQEITAEWRRLSAVAVAILNRGGEVILEAELDDDLPHLLAPGDLRGRTSSASAHRELTATELLVGRFFFLHESRATRDTGAPERGFEFLHATFADFLAARHIVATLLDLAAERLYQRRRPQGRIDPGPLYALTSFITIARRPPLWDFCRALLDRLDDDDRRSCRELVLDLLPDAGHPQPTWSMGDYQPRHPFFAVRHAAFSANLVSFAVLLASSPTDAVDFVAEPVAAHWRHQALLWHSQLDDEDSSRLWQLLRVEWTLTEDPPRLFIRPEDGADVSLQRSLPWPPDTQPFTIDQGPSVLSPDIAVPSESRLGRSIRRSAFVQTAYAVREALYDLVWFWRLFGTPDLHFVPASFAVSDASLILDLIFRDDDSADPRSLRDQFGFALSSIKASRQLENRDRLRKFLLASLENKAHLLPAEDLFPLLAGFVGDSPRDEAVLRRVVDLIERCSSAGDRMANDLISLFNAQGRDTDQPD